MRIFPMANSKKQFQVSNSINKPDPSSWYQSTCLRVYILQQKYLKKKVFEIYTQHLFIDIQQAYDLIILEMRYIGIDTIHSN